MQHPPTQTSCYLFRSLPTILLPAQSRCIHRPAKRACSPSSPSVCFALPSQRPPALAVSAPCSPLQHSPATTGRSTFTALRRHPAKALTAPCRPLSVPRNPGPTSSCLPARTLQHPSAYVHDPHSLSCASPDLRRLTFQHPRRTLHPPSRAALGSDHHCPLHPLRAASARPFVALLTSAPPPPLASDLPQPMKPSIALPHNRLPQCAHSGVFPSHSCSPPYPTAHTDQPNELAPLQTRSPAPRSPCSTLRTSLLLFASVSTDYFAPHPIPLHTQISQTASLPFKPVRLLHAPLCSTLRQPSAVLGRPHSPA